MLNMWIPLDNSERSKNFKNLKFKKNKKKENFEEEKKEKNFEEEKKEESLDDDFCCNICFEKMKVPSSFKCDYRESEITDCYGGNICFECGVLQYKLNTPYYERPMTNVTCICCNKKQSKRFIDMNMSDLVPNYYLFSKIVLETYNCDFCNKVCESHRELFNHYKSCKKIKNRIPNTLGFYTGPII